LPEKKNNFQFCYGLPAYIDVRHYLDYLEMIERGQATKLRICFSRTGDRNDYSFVEFSKVNDAILIVFALCRLIRRSIFFLRLPLLFLASALIQQNTESVRVLSQSKH